MSKSIDWGLPLLMLGFALLGFVLATVVVKQDYAERMKRQQIESDINTAKAHMTTILQLNDCYINEAFYTLDDEIFDVKKSLENIAGSAETRDLAERAKKVITDYYARFDLSATCEDCVPRSPMPVFHCTAA